MATKEDIIWFSDFLNQYDLGIRMTSYWNWLDIRNIEASDSLERILACSSELDWDRFEQDVSKEISRFGFIRVQTSLNPYDNNPNYREQILHLPQAESFKEMKMKIEVKGAVEYEDVEIKGTVEYEDTEKTI